MIHLKNCFRIATFNDNGDEFSNKDILIDNGLIKRIDSGIELTTEEAANARIIDCSGFLVIPGLVNCHHHFYQTLTRNIPGAQDAKLFDWLRHLYPIWARLDEEAVYYSTLLACAELLKTGATTTADHLYLYPRGFKGDMTAIQFEAADKLGIRFSPTRGSMTLSEKDGGLPPNHVVQNPDEVISDMRRVIERFHDDSPHAMHKIALAPCSPFSVDEEVMVETAKLAREYGVVMHTHLVETLDEENFCIEKYNRRPLRLMEDWGWVGKDVYFAHGIYFTDDELEILHETRTGICHCPTSNMRLGSGVARIKEMRELGIRLCLGVDGSASNDSSDILGEARNALLLQRVKYGSDALGAREVLHMAIRGGADILGFEGIGQIEAGFAADLAIFDMNALQYAGALSDPVAAIIFSGFCHQTVFTIVNGQIVVEKGVLKGLDEKEIIDSANKASARMIGIG